MKYDFSDPTQWNCMDHSLHNWGYMRATLPQDLFQSLKEYCVQFDPVLAPSGKETLSGLDKKYQKTSYGRRYSATHHCLLTQELKEEFWEFMSGIVSIYDSNCNYGATLKFLDDDLPFSFGDPWISVQESIHYLPVHAHEGVYSYTCWINLPPESLFEFLYPSSVGTPLRQQIRLTPKDEGDLLVFPAGLQHCVHPFDDTYKNNPIDKQCKRISVAGNVLLQTGHHLDHTASA